MCFFIGGGVAVVGAIERAIGGGVETRRDCKQALRSRCSIERSGGHSGSN